MRVLIVEDDDLSAEMLQHALEQFGYDATRAAGGQEAFEHVRTGQYRLVVSDWEMPGMTGIELCRRIRRRHGSGYVYVILLTSRSGTVNAVEGLNAGADDFISKPFQAEELCLRLRAGERLLSLEGRDIIIFTLAKLAESRDSDTGAHLERIREYCRILAQHLSQRGKYRGVIDGDYVQLIYLTSPLHDIGKVGIPDNILLKPGRLTTEEFEVMKRHTTLGYETLSAAIGAHPEVDFLQMAREIAYSHHEKYDGSGYPNGLAGEEIPLCGRIVAVADVYDALTTKRVYKPAFTHEDAKKIIVDGRGTHFDPDLVDAFLATEPMFLAVKQCFDDEAIPDLLHVDYSASRVPALCR